MEEGSQTSSFACKRSSKLPIDEGKIGFCYPKFLFSHVKNSRDHLQAGRENCRWNRDKCTALEKRFLFLLASHGKIVACTGNRL